MNEIDFSEKIISLRKINHISQEELAELCGVSRQAVSKWESGKAYPDLFRLIDLADIFEINVGDFFPMTKKYEETYKIITDTLLAGAYALFYANLDSGEVLFEMTDHAREGDYLKKCNTLNIKNCFSNEMDEAHKSLLHPDDYEMFKAGISKGNVQYMLTKQDFFTVSYRMCIGDELIYAQTVMRRASNFDKTHNFITYVRDTTDEHEDLKESQRVIKMLSNHFSSMFYVDFKKDVFRYLKMDDFIKNFAYHNAIWFKDLEHCKEISHIYANQYICPEYRDDFIRVTNPIFLKKMLQRKEQFAFTYENIRDGIRSFYMMRAIREDERANAMLVLFEKIG